MKGRDGHFCAASQTPNPPLAGHVLRQVLHIVAHAPLEPHVRVGAAKHILRIGVHTLRVVRVGRGGTARDVLVFRRGVGRGVVEEMADAALLAYSVRHLIGVYPHGEFAGEEAEEAARGEAAQTASFRHERVHLVLAYSQATVGAAFEGLLGKPVVVVVGGQNILQALTEMVNGGGIGASSPQQVRQKVGSTFYFCEHDCITGGKY